MTASALSVNKFAGEYWSDPIHHAPGVTTLQPVKVYPEFKNFGHLFVQLLRIVGTGAVSEFSIYGNDAADGSGTDYLIKSKTITAQPDADGDTLILELLGDEVARVGDENGVRLLSISVQIQLAVGTDELVINHIFGEPKYRHAALTADNVA